MENILKFVHMVGLCIWLGSMVTWAVFAPKLYKIDPTKDTTNKQNPQHTISQQKIKNKK